MTTLELFARCQDLLTRGRPPNGEQPMVVATVGADGMPNARFVLLKELDARGFVFYTNLQSTKGRELAARPMASLAFHWPALESQLRVQGSTEEVDPAHADAYWASRPRDSRLASAASSQSKPLADKKELLARYEALKKECEGRDVPRPPHWTGIRVIPRSVELWKAGPFRLHDRELFTRAPGEDEWTRTLLSP